MAASKGRTDTLDVLLEKSPQLRELHCVGFTPLHLAAQNGHVPTTARLLDLGAEVDVKVEFTDDDKKFMESANKKEDNGATPLMLASRGGHVNTAALLLAKGAKMNARDGRDRTAVSLAACEGHQEMLEFLSNRGK